MYSYFSNIALIPILDSIACTLSILIARFYFYKQLNCVDGNLAILKISWENIDVESFPWILRYCSKESLFCMLYGDTSILFLKFLMLGHSIITQAKIKQKSHHGSGISKFIFFVESTSNSKKKFHIKFYSKTSHFWSWPFWTLRLFFGQKGQISKMASKNSSHEIFYLNAKFVKLSKFFVFISFEEIRIHIHTVLLAKYGNWGKYWFSDEDFFCRITFFWTF
jgi:hypothetical protein